MNSEIKYIVINYSDSDFTNDFIDTLTDYCNNVNESLSCWNNPNYIETYNKIKTKYLTNIDVIKKDIINKLICYVLKSSDFNEIITTSNFENTLNIVKDICSDIKLYNEIEFKNIENDLGFSEFAVIYFDNEFKFKIY